MKLRNKKTGKIVNVSNFNGFVHLDEETKIYTSLTELNAEWEDYEESETYWYIDWNGEVCRSDIHDEKTEQMKLIGNYFETKEEAEKAAEKLKAWKRLKDRGFEFGSIGGRDIEFTYPDDCCNDKSFWADIDLLFGGKK